MRKNDQKKTFRLYHFSTKKLVFTKEKLYKKVYPNSSWLKMHFIKQKKYSKDLSKIFRKIKASNAFEIEVYFQLMKRTFSMFYSFVIWLLNQKRLYKIAKCIIGLEKRWKLIFTHFKQKRKSRIKSFSHKKDIKFSL